MDQGGGGSGAQKRKRSTGVYRGKYAQGGGKKATAAAGDGRAMQMQNDGSVKGVMFTCSPHRMREASLEALAVLRTCIADHFTSGGGGGGGGTLDPLEAELASLREQRELLRPVTIGIKGCVLIAFTGADADPERVVVQIMRDVVSGATPKPRHLLRLTPLQRTCRASVEDFTKACSVPGALGALRNSPPTTYRVSLRKRFCDDTVDRAEYYSAVGAIVGARHKVDLDGAEVSVLVEIFKSSVGFSVTKEWRALSEFSLAKITA